ncbi:coiled-coil domain-containing protein 89 isoform X2 [Silurus meridionalis]|nr:coiled-coil domain-containing protein 89 isoform X2 [Silurus meridionalis]
MGDLQQELEELKELSLKDQTNVEMLRSRIDEQSILICKLKQRADLTLLRCQALDRINTELRNQQVNMETDLQTERQKSEQLEKRFMDLATNHEEMIKFKDEYKQKNAELMKENKRLQEENDTFFSKELQEKEETIHKLSQGLRDIHEKHTNSEREHQEKEAILQDKLHNTQKKLKKAVDMNEEMALQFRQIQERGAMTETEAEEKFEALMKEKHKLLELSMQRGKIIQDKQEEIQELEKKKNKAEEARQEAEDRFKREADAVNTDLRVKRLQNALEKAEQKCIELKREFDAHKNYSTHLLEQERALNARLRHMIN